MSPSVKALTSTPFPNILHQACRQLISPLLFWLPTSSLSVMFPGLKEQGTAVHWGRGLLGWYRSFLNSSSCWPSGQMKMPGQSTHSFKNGLFTWRSLVSVLQPFRPQAPGLVSTAQASSEIIFRHFGRMVSYIEGKEHHVQACFRCSGAMKEMAVPTVGTVIELWGTYNYVLPYNSVN